MVWADYLGSQGAVVDDLNVTGFAPHWQSNAMRDGFVTPLSDLGLIKVSGEDAASFLHSQLSNDVEHLDNSEVRRAAYCTAKGRMLASFVYWREGENIILQTSKSLQATVQKRLQMFVLRAKAKLIDVNPGCVILGLGGLAAPEVLSKWFHVLPARVHAHVQNQNGTLLRLSDLNDHARYQWITTPEMAQQAWPELTAKLQALNTSAWRLSEIQAGIPIILASTQEEFVPQMINFELIGGVNFKKGCYPGQEIVARSQYLGKLKRRMALVLVHATEVLPGAEVFNSNDASQPCGMIVNAEQNSDDASLALVEMKLADQEGGDLTLGSASGARIELLPLPYAITDVTQ